LLLLLLPRVVAKVRVLSAVAWLATKHGCYTSHKLTSQTSLVVLLL
jgi:hypothetical protein